MDELINLLNMLKERSAADKVYLEVENYREFAITVVNYHEGKLYQFQKFYSLYMMRDINFELAMFADQAKVAIKQEIGNSSKAVV